MYDVNYYTGAPFYYDYHNTAMSAHDPSTMHAQKTGLNVFFAKYLLQKIFAKYKFGMPDTWAKAYFLYVLFCWGFISVVNTDKFGVIPQGCGLQGFDVFYRPKRAVITNPLITGILTPQIGTQCALIKLQPDYGSVMDIVEFYANMLALSASTAAVNILNSKLSYFFRASNKAQAEAFKKMFDRIASGEPAVVIDKQLANEDLDNNIKVWDTFQQKLKENYIAGDILSDMRKWEMEFDRKIGFPSANTDKKERLINAEVKASEEDTYSLARLWLETMKKGCKQANDLFGINLTVDFREKPEEEVKPENAEKLVINQRAL